MIYKIYISLGIMLFTCIQMQAQFCQENVIILNETISGNQLKQASNSITTTGVNTILDSASVEYRAGVEITLLPDFHIENGAIFDAKLEECTTIEPPTNDPYSIYQWGHLNNGNVPLYVKDTPIENRPLGGTPMADCRIIEAWQLINNPSEITVAILDSGVDTSHNDIDNSRLVHGQNFLPSQNANNYNDTFGHGTLVTGILGATPNNGIGIAGVDGNCKIMPLKVVNSSTFTADSVAVRKAIVWAKNHDADIISMSFGGEVLNSYENAMREAIDNNILIFAATGNDNGINMDYPARYPSIVAVGALTPCDERKRSTNDNDGGSCDQDDRPDFNGNWGSNYGEALDFLAPGTLLPSTDVQGSLGYSNLPYSNNDPTLQYQSIENGDYILDAFGTSMSSPFAAGIASLVWSVKPSLKNYQVRYIMQKTARDITPNISSERDDETGFGALDAKAAIEMAQTFNNSDFLLSNLSLESINIPVTTTHGNNLQINLRIKNIGDKFAQASKLKYRVSGPFSGIGNFVSGTINIATLNPQQFTDKIISIPIICANNFTPGNYTIEFEVDVDKQVDEFNEFNRYEKRFEVIGLPDLVIEDEILSYNQVNNNYIVSYKVKNNGIGVAYFKGFISPIFNFYKYYESVDNQLDSGDSLVEFENISNYILCPGDEISKTQDEIQINNPTSNFLLVQIDSGNEIDEGNNENNNVVAIPITTNSPEPVNSIEKQSNSSLNIKLIPNPIKDSGIIKYTLENDSKVSISVTDLTGISSNIILSEKNQTKGDYEIPIYKSNLKTGIYIIEVIVNEDKHFKKLILE